MSALPRDRADWNVGAFIKEDECGHDYLIDALATKQGLGELIGGLIQCGEGKDIDAQIGAAVRKAACTYQPLLDAIAQADRIARWKERQMEIELSLEPEDRRYGAMGVRL